MSANIFGERFRVATFGESHGAALGCVVDGCPAGVAFDETLLRFHLARRRPGDFGGASGPLVSPRKEGDEAELLSGVFEGKTLGTPIALLVRNRDARSSDYPVGTAPRAGHADDVWVDKFGLADGRGGGRSSGRETVARVLAGSVAEMYLRTRYPALRVVGFARQIGAHALEPSVDLAALTQHDVDRWPARFPSAQSSTQVRDLLLAAREEGKSYGGTAELHLRGCPRGLGEPVFRKLKAELGAAFLSVGAVAGVELGDGFDTTAREGSEFHARGIDHASYGGVRGGIATGETIVARVAFKPTSSVLDVAKRGRHDPCIVPRAIPVLEAMAWLVLADLELSLRTNRVEGGLR